MSETESGFSSVIEAGLASRRRIERKRRFLGLLIPLIVTLLWLSYVVSSGSWQRVVQNWESGLTMVFGSFVAGSTPQGGGAVAFPVFTKALQVPSEIARTFSLVIQTVGMGTAALAIVLTGREVSWKTILRAFPGALLGFAIALLVFSDLSHPFAPSRIPSSYVKVSFTLIVAAMALITYLGSRVPVRLIQREAPPMNPRLWVVLVILSILGGLASGLTGSGADVFLYLAVVVLMAVDPKVGIPTSVVLMALISLVGFLFLGVFQGQLDIELSDDGQNVIAVGGEEIVEAPASDGELEFSTVGEPPPAGSTDLFGLWLAAVPVVAWGAPIGSAVAARMSMRSLIGFVVSLAALETLSTAIFLDELRSDTTLIVFALSGGVVLSGGLWWMAKTRLKLLGLPRLEHTRAISRSDIDVHPAYREALGPDDSPPIDDEEMDN